MPDDVWPAWQAARSAQQQRVSACVDAFLTSPHDEKYSLDAHENV